LIASPVSMFRHRSSICRHSPSLGANTPAVAAHFASNPGLLEQPARESQLAVSFGGGTGHRHHKNGLCVITEDILCILVPRLCISKNKEGVFVETFPQKFKIFSFRSYLAFFAYPYFLLDANIVDQLTVLVVDRCHGETVIEWLAVAPDNPRDADNSLNIEYKIEGGIKTTATTCSASNPSLTRRTTAEKKSNEPTNQSRTGHVRAQLRVHAVIKLGSYRTQ